MTVLVPQIFFVCSSSQHIRFSLCTTQIFVTYKMSLPSHLLLMSYNRTCDGQMDTLAQHHTVIKFK